MSLQAALMAVVVPYAAVAVAGWRGLRAHGRRAEEPVEQSPPRAGFVLGRTRLSMEVIPAHAAITYALRDLDRVAARQLTHLSVAAADGLTVRADPLALHEVLVDVVRTAINRAPCGSVLVTARLHGGRIEIGVTDDGDVPCTDALSAASDTSRQILALHGGTLEARSTAYGTEIALRLLAPQARAKSDAAPAAAPVKVEDGQGSKRNSVVERSVRSSSSKEVGTV